MKKNSVPLFLSMNELIDNYNSDLDEFIDTHKYETEADFLHRLKNLFLTQFRFAENGELLFAITMTEFDYRIKNYKYLSIDAILYAINSEMEGYNLSLLEGYVSITEPFPLFRLWQNPFNENDEEYECDKLPYLECEEIRDLFFFNGSQYDYKKNFYDLFKISYPQILGFINSKLRELSNIPTNFTALSEQAKFDNVKIAEKIIFSDPIVVETAIKDRITTKHHVLAYIIDSKAIGMSLPRGIKKEIEGIGNDRLGSGKGNTFYKNYNLMINYEFEKEEDFFSIAGENWRNIILHLSHYRDAVEEYLQSMKL